MPVGFGCARVWHEVTGRPACATMQILLGARFHDGMRLQAMGAIETPLSGQAIEIGAPIYFRGLATARGGR